MLYFCIQFVIKYFIVQAHGGEDAIKHHPFFRDVKWKELEERKVKPPFKPKFVSFNLTTETNETNLSSLQKNRKEATNFDTEFTKEDPVLTPVNPDITKTIQQVSFKSYEVQTQHPPYCRRSLTASASPTLCLASCWPLLQRSTETLSKKAPSLFQACMYWSVVVRSSPMSWPGRSRPTCVFAPRHSQNTTFTPATHTQPNTSEQNSHNFCMDSKQHLFSSRSTLCPNIALSELFPQTLTLGCQIVII